MLYREKSREKIKKLFIDIYIKLWQPLYMNKTLIFEGAGWEKASSASDIGNCRIRTRIKNNDGEIIYLEMMGRKKSEWSTYGRKKNWSDFVGFVFHCHTGYDSNKMNQYCKLEIGTIISWDAKTLIEWVNKNLNCSFNSLRVENDGVQVHNTKLPLCESLPPIEK